MDNSDFEDLNRLVKSKLSEKRYNHTMAVVKLASELATHYNESVVNAKIAAVLHDITKEDDEKTQLQIIKNSDIIIDTVYEKNNNLHHGLTAFLYARDTLKIKNMDILNAVRYHTTARDNMSMLEKIIYISDATAYDRKYQDVEHLRKMSFEDIDLCLTKIIEFTINDLLRKNKLIAIETIQCYNSIIVNKGE